MMCFFCMMCLLPTQQDLWPPHLQGKNHCQQLQLIDSSVVMSKGEQARDDQKGITAAAVMDYACGQGPKLQSLKA